MAAKPKAAPPARSPHHGQVQSTDQGSQISPATFRPHADAQITETVGTNPDAPANRQASPDVAQVVPYTGQSPTGFNPATGQDWDAAVTSSL